MMLSIRDEMVKRTQTVSTEKIHIFIYLGGLVHFLLFA